MLRRSLLESMFLIGHYVRSVPRSGRKAVAFRVAPSTWVYFSSSSNIASRGHDRHDLHGAPSILSESWTKDHKAEDRKHEASIAGVGQQAAPGSEPRPEASGTTPLTEPQLAHEQQNRDLRRAPSSSGKETRFRYVRIFGLSTDMTLADILRGIAQTAPVGRVLHVEWGKRGTITHRGMKVKTAFVLFDTDAAAADLVRLAKQKVFLVRRESVHVSIWNNCAFSSNDDSEISSRVLHIRGPQDVEGFSEEGIRDLLMSNDMLVKALGPLGLGAEAVVTSKLGGGKQLIEWRFFSNAKQARPVLFFLRRSCYKSLSITFGPDLCWNEELYPRGRMVTKDAIHLPALRKHSKWPSVRGYERMSSDKAPHHSSERVVTKPAFWPDEKPWDHRGKHSTHDNPLFEKLFGNVQLALGERQHERIAAWTGRGQSSKTDTQHDQEENDHQKHGNS